MSDRPDRPAPSRDPKRPSRPKLRNQLLFVVGILLLAGGAFYTALVVATQIDQIFFPDSQLSVPGPFKSLPGIDAKNTGDDVGSGGRINVLVMGLDRRPAEGATAPARTDTMFVMTIDPSTHTARGLGIPRDLYVDIPSKTGNTSFKERVNAAYVVGELQGYNGGGPGLAEKTIENLLGIKIDYYVVIDFEGFKQVIDGLGGIDIDVPSPGVNDPFYSDTEKLGDYFPCVFKPGIHHMDGTEALCYARTRYNSSDLDRILRQQLVMFAVMDKATQLHVLADPTNINNLWKRYKSTINTNISDFQIPGFAKLAQGIDQSQIAFLSLGAATTPFTTSEGAAVLLPSKEGIKQLVDAFVSDNRLLQEAAMVEVRNCSGVAGKATKAADYFTGLGIPTASLIAINDGNCTQAKTQVVDFNDKTYTSDQLANWLGIQKSQTRASTAQDAGLRESNADIVVILGSDAKVESAVGSP